MRQKYENIESISLMSQVDISSQKAQFPSWTSKDAPCIAKFRASLEPLSLWQLWLMRLFSQGSMSSLKNRFLGLLSFLILAILIPAIFSFICEAIIRLPSH